MALPHALLTGAEYLPLERKATEGRSELIGGLLVAMAGATFAHGLIVGNLSFHFKRHLRAKGCYVTTESLRVQVDEKTYLYPDLVAVWDEPQFADSFNDTLMNPVLIVEVLSPSTELYDRGTKLRRYQRIPSVQACMLVSQVEALVELYERQPDGSWRYTATMGRETSVIVPTLEEPVALADIFDQVEFKAVPPELPL